MSIRLLFRPLPYLPGILALALSAPLLAEDHAALGRAALESADYPAAVAHLEAASRELEGGDREVLAQLQTDLGIAYLTGLGKPTEALRAFVRAADLAANPASAWLWASTAALAAGDEEESERYKRLALKGRGAAEKDRKNLEETKEPAPEATAPPEFPKPAPPQPLEPAPPNPPAPEPVAVEQPSAFGHFFGGKPLEPAVAAEEAPASVAASTDKDLKDSKDVKDEKKKPEVAPDGKPAPSAFDHFFKAKPADEAQEPAAGEPPPAGDSVRL